MAYGEKIEALAAPTRRAVFERLADGPLSVGELASGLPVSRPAVSQHLRVLKEADLVVESKCGTKRIYAINSAGLSELRDYFDRFWDDALVALKRAVEMDEP